MTRTLSSLVVLLFVALLATTAHAEGMACGPCIATWDAPVNGTPVTYNIYIASVSTGPFTKVGNVPAGVITSYAIDLTGGQKYIQIAGVNSRGIEGAKSAPTPFDYSIVAVTGPPVNVQVKQKP